MQYFHGRNASRLKVVICVFVDSLSSCSLGLSPPHPQLAFLAHFSSAQFYFFLGFAVASVSTLDQIPVAKRTGGEGGRGGPLQRSPLNVDP